jgi:hypothetical protein
MYPTIVALDVAIGLMSISNVKIQEIELIFKILRVFKLPKHDQLIFGMSFISYGTHISIAID